MYLKRPRNIRKYLKHLEDNDTFYLGFPASRELLLKAGFAANAAPGDSLLPDTEHGPASRVNAEGRVIVHRDQPMEEATRQVEWTWKQFCGRDDFTYVTDVRDFKYMRYPRAHEIPYAVELELKETANGERIVVAGPFTVGVDDVRASITARMFVEVFGGWEVLDGNLTQLRRVPVRRCNWNMLPAGDCPWPQLRAALQSSVDRAPAGNRPVIMARHEFVAAYEPSELLIGTHGFNGYVAFVFKKHGFAILESNETGNATYVLGLDNWEDITKLTKAEILNGRLHKPRLIHCRSWFDALKNLFPKTPAEPANDSVMRAVA